VSEREIRPLFERSLQKMEEMVMEGIPFFLFQPSVPSDSRRAYLTKRLSQFSNWVWRIELDDQGTEMVLEKGSGLKTSLKIVNCKMKNENLEEKISFSCR